MIENDNNDRKTITKHTREMPCKWKIHFNPVIQIQCNYLFISQKHLFVCIKKFIHFTNERLHDTPVSADVRKYVNTTKEGAVNPKKYGRAEEHTNVMS